MRTSLFTAPRIAAAALALTIALAAVPQTAGALEITHNGVNTGGIVTEAHGDNDVGLADLLFLQIPAIVGLCDESGVDACLAKSWIPGTQGDLHEMEVFPDDSDIVIGELVLNATGVPWTDYHLQVLNADISSAEVTLFEIDAMGTVEEITGGLTTQVTDHLVSVFFDTPLATIDITGSSYIALGILLEIADAGNPFTITQQPSLGVPEPATLTLLGLGLAGLGIVRRRRAGRRMIG